jgi:hypothetical protein
METIILDNGIFICRENIYELVEIIDEPEMNVLVSLKNEEYSFMIALVPNETSINGVIQTSSEMIVETLKKV